MVVSGPNARAVTPVMQGAKAAVFGAVDYVSYGNIQQGESLKVIFPASGTVIAPRPMMILKPASMPTRPKPLSITCCRRKVRRGSPTLG